MNDDARDMAELLARLRDRIDTIDESMHRLLIERGTVVDQLIQAKGTQRPGAAFRPGREADMMQRIGARHEGGLPLATVEHIWREIIATFTHMQAPYDVTIDGSVEPERARDLARFMFGFSLAVTTVDGADKVVDKVAEGRDLGLVARAAPGVWWQGLEGEDRPQVMALLPFIRIPCRSADLPAFVISPPLSDPKPADVRVLSVTGGDRPAGEGVAVLAEAGPARLVAALPGAEVPAGDAISVVDVGGFFLPISADGKPVALGMLAADQGGAS